MCAYSWLMSETAAATPPARPHDPTRTELRGYLAEVLDRYGVPWAWQGPTGAAAAWDSARGPADLDVWWDPSPAARAEVLRELGQLQPFAVVAESTDPRRLRHLSLAFEVAGDLAVVDFTAGDLLVGPVRLVPAADVRVEPTPDGPRLAGVAAAADLLIRPLLRGKTPPEARVAESQRAWASTTEVERAAALVRWRSELGSETHRVAEVLAGAECPPDLAGRLRRRLLARTLAPSGVAAAWRQRWSVAPAGRAAGPLKLRTRGVVVALVGTDGSGKSTVARSLRERLEALGYTTAEAYFGMARGNLPGVGLARRVLGIKAEPEDPDPPTGRTEVEAAGPAELNYPMIRRAAAWFYAAEYAWRYARHVAPEVRRRSVVVCDRYVYDLRDSPWPGSAAARFAEWLVPPPDVLVLPDAPAELIHARKPERALAEQARQQQEFAALLAERPARCAELVVDTSGADPDPAASIVAAVVAASHRPRR